jgi:hypothetical protein
MLTPDETATLDAIPHFVPGRDSRVGPFAHRKASRRAAALASAGDSEALVWPC